MRILIAFLLGISWLALPTEWAQARAEHSAPEVSLRPKARPDATIAARWDHLPSGALWTRAALAALRGHASKLPNTVPKDIAHWCPAYEAADTAGRQAFWVGLLSTLAKHESTWRPTAVGGNGRWYGLTQILPATARFYGCTATSGQALLSGPANLSCALRILSVTVPRDQVISQNMRGVAADWGPFHSARKRTDMQTWMLAQPYCRLPVRSLRPKLRPY